MANSPVKTYRRRLRYTDLSGTWQDILWRERHHCDDAEYAGRLYKVIEDENHSLTFKQQPRPYLTEVEVALRQGSRKQSGVKNVWGPQLDRLYREKHKPIPPEKLIVNLQHIHWLERFIARHVLVYRGGAVVGALEALVRESSGWVKDTTIWLLESIGADTQIRLAEEKDNLLCPQCRTFCQKHWADIPWQRDIAFYGCRVCRQSRKLFHCPLGVVVVLDNTWTETYRQQDGLLYVNWSSHPVHFDFDRIKIIQATDEDVERFAVQVGNDTDPFRKPRYKQMRCIVGAECRLSENTLRILERMFGQIERINGATNRQ